MLPPLRNLNTQHPMHMNGKRLLVRVYRCEHRLGARRVVVLDGDAIIFDSGDCYDAGNAQAALDHWVAAQVHAAN